jgi:hypothetical protein
MLGCSVEDPVLHVCGGLAREYPYSGGFGSKDFTLDLDPAVCPDFLLDARKQWPSFGARLPFLQPLFWKGILIDSPYSPEDARKYPPGESVYPTPEQLLKRATEVLSPGCRVGIIHYLWPRPVPGLSSEKGVFAVGTGRNGRARWFVVFERTA